MTTANQNALRQRLLALLVAETQQINDFVVLLEKEHEILLGQDVQPLYAISEQKTQHARQLQHLADSRAAIMAQAKLPQTREAIESLIGTEGQQIWNNYLSIATKAKRLNESNGKHITVRLSHNHQALAVLMAHSDQPTIYGPDGASHTHPGSRLLGSY